MSDNSSFGFGKFIPGFDFLQSLVKSGSSSAGLPPMSHWVAPTVSVEEISKRIEELKAVQFWLEQNSRALTATVQALEVQKMTLHTLEGMNVSMADLSKAFTGNAAAAPAAASPFTHAGWPMNAGEAASPAPAAAQAADAASAKAAASESEKQERTSDAEAGAAAGPAGLGDPMQWWGALSQQFQHIAAQALQDPSKQQAVAQSTQMATDFTKAAMEAASSMVRTASEGVKTAAATTAQATAAAAAPRARKPAAPAKPAAKATSAAPRAGAAAPAAPAKTARKPAAKKTAAKPAAAPRAGRR